MTSFVHVDQPASHPGVVRATAAIQYVAEAGRRFDGAQGLAALLLGAIVSALLVVADRLMSTSEQGGLLAGWLVLWVVAFAAIAFFAGTARSLSVRAMSSLRQAARRRAAARADAEFLAYARFDQRILRDLDAAVTRQQPAVESAPAAAARPAALEIVARRSAEAMVPTMIEAMRRVNLGKYY